MFSKWKLHLKFLESFLHEFVYDWIAEMTAEYFAGLQR